MSSQFLTLLSEERDGTSSERTDKELALTKTVDATALSMENPPVSDTEMQSVSDMAAEPPHEITQRSHLKMSIEEKAPNESGIGTSEKAVEEGKLISYQRKVTVLYELLSACVTNPDEDENKAFQLGKGYDARHRVALRLLATWLCIEWTEMVCLLELLII